MKPSVTPLHSEDAIPVVLVTVERRRQVNLFHLTACPYCGRRHVHGAGLPTEDPRDFQGHRVSHCSTKVSGDRGYILRIADEGHHKERDQRGTPAPHLTHGADAPRRTQAP